MNVPQNINHGSLHAGLRCESSNHWEKGSLLVAGAILIMMFFMVGTLAVDMSRYFHKKSSLQSVADNAARAGAQALNQFQENPNEIEVEHRVLDYIRQHQGNEVADLYEVRPDGNVEGIYVDKKTSPHLSKKLSCPPDFTYNDKMIMPTEPFTMKSKVVGAYLGYSDGTRAPTTAKLRLQQMNEEDGDGEMEVEDSSDTQPWGPYDDPQAGNVNTGQYKTSLILKNLKKNTRIKIFSKGFAAESKDPDQPMINKVETGKKDPELYDQYPAKYFRDGDKPPEVPGGYNQPSVATYLSEYVKDGRYDLKKNQVIVALDVANSNENLDYNDFIVLLTLNRTSSVDGEDDDDDDSGSSSSTTSSDNDCGVYYKVGVTSFFGFKPVLLPKSIFGNRPALSTTHAVAEAYPQYRKQYTAIRRGDTGLVTTLPGDLDYETPNQDNVNRLYGAKSSPGQCDKSDGFVQCSSTTALNQEFAPDDDQKDRVFVSDQVVYINGSLTLDATAPGDTSTISSLRGNGYVLVENDIRIQNKAALNGDLDLVSLNGDIVFEDLDQDLNMHGYLVAQSGELTYNNVDSGRTLNLWGGMFAKNGGTGRISLQKPLEFCPITSSAELCKSAVSEYSEVPYSWDISLAD